MWNSINEAAKADLIDWDLVLSMGNAQYHRIVEAIHKPTCVRGTQHTARCILG